MDQTIRERRIGIPGVEKSTWGDHLCVFFNSKDELLNLVVPYMKAVKLGYAQVNVFSDFL